MISNIDKVEMIRQLRQEYNIHPIDVELEDYTIPELAMLLLVASWIERTVVGEKISMLDFNAYKHTFLQFIKIESMSRGLQITNDVIQSWDDYFNPEVDFCEIAYIIMFQAKERIQALKQKKNLKDIQEK